jgi:BMFP domain-containing protein YqiC
MTKSFAKECAPLDIRVNALLPGLTDTKFASALTGNDSILKQAMTHIPMKRTAMPEEMKMMAKAHFQQLLVQANLVTREEFDVQADLLDRTQQRLGDLEQQLAELQNQLLSEQEPKDKAT